MLLIMILDQYSNYYKALQIYTGHFDSLDIMILFSYPSSTVITRDYCTFKSFARYRSSKSEMWFSKTRHQNLMTVRNGLDYLLSKLSIRDKFKLASILLHSTINSFPYTLNAKMFWRLSNNHIFFLLVSLSYSYLQKITSFFYAFFCGLKCYKGIFLLVLLSILIRLTLLK